MRRALIVFLVLSAGGVYYVAALPNPADLQRTTPDYTALMLLRLEQAKEQGKKWKPKRQWVPLREISPLLRDAVRTSEDASFYDHDGFDFDEIEDALRDSWQQKRMVRGASTISQQLVKNVYLSPTRNPLRKVSEAILTYRLEEAVDKNRILELYLNLIEWGDGIFGIEAAARYYFSETAYTLDASQVALLAAMLPMPLRVDPRAPNKWLLARSRRLLRALHASGRLSDAEFADAIGALAKN